MNNYMIPPDELKEMLNRALHNPNLRKSFSVYTIPPHTEKGILVSDPDMDLERFVNEFVNNDQLLEEMQVVKKDRRMRGYFRYKVVQYVRELKTWCYTYDINEYPYTRGPGPMVFIYGSLKRGHYNHTRFNFHTRTWYWGEAVLTGAALYNLGTYPCLVMTGNQEDTVRGELYEYLDDSCRNMIHEMEFGAGYRIYDVEVEGEHAETYVFNSVPEGARIVEGGVWKQPGVDTAAFPGLQRRRPPHVPPHRNFRTISCTAKFELP